MELRGLLCAFGAAVAFGVQYAPVKRYEIFDGTTFQWFMCSGILMVGFCVALITGDLERGCPQLVVFGGTLWALSNYFVLPLVKLLGIGLGFSLYHFVNLVVGYLVGRLGLFGVPVLQGDLHICDLGCGLILTSFIVMVFVETDGGDSRTRQLDTRPSLKRSATEPAHLTEAGLTDQPPLWGNPAAEYRAIYRHWRLAGMGLSPSAAPGMRALLSSPDIFMGARETYAAEYRSVAGFAVQETPDFVDAQQQQQQQDLALDSPYLPPVTAVAAAEAAARVRVAAEQRGDPRGGLPSAAHAGLADLSLPEAVVSPFMVPGRAGAGPAATGSSSGSPGPTAERCTCSRAGSPPPQLRQDPADGHGSGLRMRSPDIPQHLQHSPPGPSAGMRFGAKLTGILLAIAGGGFCGVQSVPATLYNQANPGAPPTSVVFPQCLGIWAASSVIYLVYAIVAKVGGWRVPHSAIRPAYTSGAIWACGFLLMIAGIRDLGYSVGYTLDAAGPIMVSSLLSLLVFHEITGRTQILLYFAGFSLQLAGVSLIAAYGRAQ